MNKDIAVDKNNAFVVDIGALQVTIKKHIVQDVKKGIDKAETDKKVQKSTERFLRQIKSNEVRKKFLNNIARNYNKWYAMFIASMGALALFQKEVEQAIPKGKVGIGFRTDTRQYLIDQKITTVMIADYEKKVAQAKARIIKELSEQDFKEVDGGTLRNYAEIRVRWEANRDDISTLKAQGVKLVWSSSHANSSTRCYPWQGRLYSLDGTSGSANGNAYIPLEIAMLGTQRNNNGLLGYNCRHRLIPYFEGSTPPEDFSAKEIKKEQAIDQKQRYMERRIRQLREQAVLTSVDDRKRGNILYERAEVELAKYRQYSKDNNRTAYLYRTQITREV